jgi:hypothetical protein
VFTVSIIRAFMTRLPARENLLNLVHQGINIIT